eukprot:7383236-Lingulodinium_polyedra.AAC.1
MSAQECGSSGLRRRPGSVQPGRASPGSASLRGQWVAGWPRWSPAALGQRGPMVAQSWASQTRS